MRDMFDIINTKTLSTKLDGIYDHLGALDYDTRVLSSSGNQLVKDYSKVCHDTYRDITASIDSVLSSIKQDYDKKADLQSVLSKLIEDTTSLKSTWDNILKNKDKCVVQSLQDATSERIFNYKAATAVTFLLAKIQEFFCCDNIDKGKQIEKIYNRCLEYAKDKNFELQAGEPMIALGYIDLESMYEIAYRYTSILNSLNTDTIMTTVEAHRTKLLAIENEIQTLNVLVSRNINRAESLDPSTLHQYQTLLQKTHALASIHRLCILMTGLLTSVKKTVDNLSNVALNSQTSSPLANITEDMGGTLQPEIIETQSVANEGFKTFVGKLIDRYKTFKKDLNTALLDKYTTIPDLIKFIEDHLDPKDVNTYLQVTKWKGIDRKTMESVNNKIQKHFDKYDSLFKKLKAGGEITDLFPYTTEQEFDISELQDSWNLLKEFVKKVYVFFKHYSAGAYGDYVYTNDLKDIEHPLEYQNYSVCYYDSDTIIPNIVQYASDGLNIPKVDKLTGKQIGVKNLDDLKSIGEFSKSVGKACNKFYDTFSKINVNDFDFPHRTADESKKKLAYINYYRAYIFLSINYLLMSIQLGCMYFPYKVILDVKKYA